MNASSQPVFKVFFIGLFLLTLLTQFYYGRKGYRRGKRVFSMGRSEARREGLCILGLHVLAFVLLLIGSVLYVINSNWMLSWAAPFPRWLRWVGTGLGSLSFIGLVWVHRALGRYWSPYLKLQDDHRLVTHGPYRWVRHPMYSMLIGVMVGLGFVSANWLLVVLFMVRIAFIFLRLGREEAMLVERFGDEYRSYMRRTGRLLPRFIS